jgi:hypothetical protein|tara:strand:- start:196 stop:429 length:234 start_codon:yes stop_codon:yes gene_type:complete
MGYYVIISHITNRKENMFYITYYAKKHKKFITRKGQYDKPDGTEGKAFVSKQGNPCLVYWDLEADGWRMAVGDTTIR